MISFIFQGKKLSQAKYTLGILSKTTIIIDNISNKSITSWRSAGTIHADSVGPMGDICLLYTRHNNGDTD